MRFEELKSRLLQVIKGPTDGEIATPRALRVRQLTLLAGGSTIVFGGLLYFLSSSDANSDSIKSASKPTSKSVNELTTPLGAIDEREVWVNRVEKKTTEVREESERLRDENQFLQKRIDVLEELFKGATPTGARPTGATPQDGASKGEGGTKDKPAPPAAPDQPTFPSPPAQTTNQPQRFAPLTGEMASGPQFASGHMGGNMGAEMMAPPRKTGPKIAHLGGGKFSQSLLRTSDLYLPAGSFSKAVITSGVAASTATNAQGNPQPMMLRLVDEGNLPRGFKSRVRDAVVLGACYGDISSERVLCRIETMSWVEPNGVTVEKKVEGWVIGEDGRAGLRGEVVDRSGEVAREAFGAGILSAAANFLKFEAQSSVYPVTPFGQTKALGKGDALQGAAASGAGNALDKLADFSIRRAEQMQPVILVASGRVVDIVFKAGVDLSPDAQAELQMVGAQKSSDSDPVLQHSMEQ